MHYQFATADDAPQLARLNQQLIADEGHRNAMTLAQLERRMAGWLAGGYEAVLFIDQGEARGYALYRRGSEHVYVRQFFVCRGWRRRGVGRAAIQWLRRHAWAEAPRLRVDVLIGNAAAIAFWRSVGFQDYCLTLEAEGTSPPSPAPMADR